MKKLINCIKLSLVAIGFISGQQVFAQLASTPCASGPLPSASNCQPENVTITGGDSNSGVADPGNCPSTGSTATAGTIYDSDIWFTTNADASGNIDVYAAIVSAGADPIVGIYNGSCGSLAFIACDDDGGAGLDANVSATGLTPGETIWVRLWEYGGLTTGVDETYQVTTSGGTPPSNDDCTAATGLTVGAAPIPGSTYCASPGGDPLNNCGNSPDNTVWYSFTAGGYGNYTVNITGNSCFGSLSGVDISVYNGACSSFVEMGCGSPNNPSGSVSFTGFSGQTYHIMIDGVDDGLGNTALCDFNIDVDFTAIPCPTVGYDTYNGLGATGAPIPFPATMSCTDGPISFWPWDSATAGGWLEFGYKFFVPMINGEVNNTEEFINDGFSLGTLTAPANTQYTVTVFGLSPTSVNDVILCENPGLDVDMSYVAYDLQSGAIITSGTWLSNGLCTTVSIPGPLSGLAYYTGNGVLTSDGGYGEFHPDLAGPGTHTVSFYWTNGTCTDSVIRTITVTSPNDASWSVPAATVCLGSNYDLYPQVSGTGGGVFTGTDVTFTGSDYNFNPTTPGTYTITYSVGTAPCDDTESHSIVVQNPSDATITSASFCPGDPASNLSAVDAGGTWSGTGITNGANGTFNPATAGAGTHVITYAISGTCGATDTENIVVNANMDATISASSVLCDDGGTVSMTAVDGGGTWSGTGINGSGVFDPSSVSAGTYNITYTISGSCGDSDTENVVVEARLNATISPASFCPADAATNLTAVDGGGTWSGTGITNAGAGTFDPSVAGAGTHVITYSLAGNCGDTDTENIVVNSSFDATITPAAVLCDNGGTVTMTAADAGGTWSGTGINGSGVFDPSSVSAGTYNVTYTISGSCGDSDTEDVIVDPQANATITGASFCPFDAPGNLVAVDGGGTWSGPGITDAVNGTFDPTVSGFGTHTITYSIGGACGDTQTQNVVVDNPLDASITSVGAVCESDAAFNIIGANPGGTWSGTGITDVNNGTFDPSVAGAGTHNVTYGIPGACGDTDTEDVIVDPAPDATISPSGSMCTIDPPVNLTSGTAGGTWSGTGITDAVNGTFDPAVAGNGTHIITYNVSSGVCSDSDTEQVIVSSNPDATINAISSMCTADGITSFTAVDVGGFWTGSGIVDSVAGSFDPAVAGPGTYTISYVIGGSCGDSDTESVVVDQSMNATITDTSMCPLDPAVNLSAVDAGGSWSGTGITDAVNGTFDPTVSGNGTFSIIYTLAGSCGDIDTGIVVVNNPLDATITAAGPFCSGDIAQTLSGTSPGGTWSGTGITNSSAGTFDPVTAGVGTHSIVYSIPGGCGDTDTLNIVVDLSADPTISATATYCIIDPADTLVSVDAGGTWSGIGVTDTNVGVFDPATAGTGTHNVSYVVGTGSCSATDTEDIIVVSNPDATISTVSPLCTNDAAVTLNGVTNGGTWSGPGVVSGQFDPAVSGAGTHEISYAFTGSCADSDTLQIVVSLAADASFSTQTFCVGDASANLSSTNSGGIWSGTGITNSTNGTFDPTTAGAGTHIVSYEFSGTCGDTQTGNIVVQPIPDASITPVSQLCEGDAAFNLTAASGGGTWAGAGVTDVNNGTFDPTVLNAGTYNVTYNISGNCPASDVVSIVIASGSSASILPVSPLCEYSASFTMTNIGDPGGVWTGPGIVNINTGEFNPDVAGPGTHVVTYFISGTCGDTQTETVIVNPEPEPPFITSDTGCAGNLYPIELYLPDSNVSYNWFIMPSGDTVALNTFGIDPGVVIPDNSSDTTYQFVVQGLLNGCVSQTTAFDYTVIQGISASFEATPDTGEIPLEVTFTNTSTGVDSSASFWWDFGTGDTSNLFEPTYTFEDLGTYQVVLYVNDPSGLCPESVSEPVEIITSGTSELVIPNVFSPNNDNVNDVFNIIGANIIMLHGEIWSRWGELVFIWDSVEQGWDGRTITGTPATEGSYIFFLHAEGADGRVFDEKGTVTLVR